MNMTPTAPFVAISQIGLWRMMGVCLLLFFSKQSAHADVWGFVDAKGVAHFATERVDERYGIFSRSGESFDTQNGVRQSVESHATAAEPAPSVPPTVLTAGATRLVAYFDNSKQYKAFKPYLRDAAQAHNIEFELLQALIVTESGFDDQALSPKGAMGLMQIMPATAARYGVAGDKNSRLERKLFDPGTNIKVGSRYLRDLLNLFPGQIELALAAYNAGEGAVQRAGNKIPNYKETQNYVKTVMQLYTLLKPPLKPPVLVPEKYSLPTRVRMEIPGGAAKRSNMISPVQALNPILHPTPDTP